MGFTRAGADGLGGADTTGSDLTCRRSGNMARMANRAKAATLARKDIFRIGQLTTTASATPAPVPIRSKKGPFWPCGDISAARGASDSQGLTSIKMPAAKRYPRTAHEEAKATTSHMGALVLSPSSLIALLPSLTRPVAETTQSPWRLSTASSDNSLTDLMALGLPIVAHLSTVWPESKGRSQITEDLCEISWYHSTSDVHVRNR